MFVQTTAAGSTPAGSYASGAVMEIPREMYNPLSMTRLGRTLTGAQLAALVPWSSVSPGWPWSINPE